ncbi:SpaH/EbpB family LPXTG-anchored major pilin [Leucobacter sp. CSA1]|uniref:SpaH/EbpB family LPXTG-anchored major pilin n=1 Tax=Leucobacter chromiisoli TaxID=2796471 RepID=A0A934Q5G8_9MICO|nr:SpaH/EbpB family LPXTG-anchored major pilin [Leucobacter chromiisoli]MBK0417745.1 SpaH/EbpB family LPXTG-anchored major pilin [Leucobacter chromiisoli]
MKQSLRRLTAGAGIVALAVLGAAGSAAAASATEGGGGGYPVVPDQDGTLTLHKHVEDPRSTDGNPAGAPLEGVEFTIQQVGTGTAGDCDAIDLTVPGGWQSVSEAIDGFESSAPDLPAGFCFTGVSDADTTASDGSVTFAGLRGLFLVTETDPGDNMITAPADPFLVTVPQPVEGQNGAADSWDFSVDAYPKNTLTTVNPTKTVGATDELTPDAVVDWTITVPVPQLAFPYSQIEVTDSPAAGHVFNGFTSVTYDGVPLTSPADYTVSGSTIALTPAGLATVGTGGGDLVVKLTTKVDGSHIGELKNEASVKLNGTSTPTDKPQTNWGKLKVLKHQAKNETATLAGAEFAVYEQTGGTCPTPAVGTPVTTGATDANGVFERILWISNTNPGEAVGSKVYCLYETKAPTGYVLDSTPREATISAANEWVHTVKFPNVPVEGPKLPLTGSTGTMAFGLVGLGLIGAAAATLAVRRARAHR